MEVKYKNTKYTVRNKMLKHSLGAILFLSACSIGTDAFGMFRYDVSNGDWSFGPSSRPQLQPRPAPIPPKIQDKRRPRAVVVYPVSKRVEERQITMEEFNQLQGQGTKIKFYGRTRSNGELKRIDYGHYLRRLGENTKHRPVTAKICGQ